MMATTKTLNKVILIGYLGREPEMRYLPTNGQPVTVFSVATLRNWVDDNGESHEETEWFNVVTWGDLAEACKQHLHNGDRVYIEGRLQTRRWKGSDATERFRTELVAGEVIPLEPVREDRQ